MYGKIFKEIFYGSLMMNDGWLSVYVMMSLVTLAEDEEGIVRYDERALYRLLGLENSDVNYEKFTAVIEALNKPDPTSNLKAMDGRRVIPLSELKDIEGNRGFWIVNYDYYSKKGSRDDRREKATERKRRQRERKNHLETTMSRNVTQRREKSAHTDTDTDTDIKPLCAKTAHGDFETFWKTYPKKKSKGAALKAWNRIKPTPLLARTILKSIEIAKTSEDWTKNGGQFVPHPATWLNAMGWEDEHENTSEFEGAL